MANKDGQQQRKPQQLSDRRVTSAPSKLKQANYTSDSLADTPSLSALWSQMERNRASDGKRSHGHLDKVLAYFCTICILIDGDR